MVSVVHNTFSAIWVAEWPPLWKLLPARLANDLILFCLFLNFYLFPFFESRSGLVSFQTDHSNILQYFMLKCLFLMII